MYDDVNEAGPGGVEATAPVEMGDLIRYVVLPAGNLEMALSLYLEDQGQRLDTSTRALLAGARDGIRGIAQHGISLARQHDDPFDDA